MKVIVILLEKDLKLWFIALYGKNRRYFENLDFFLIVCNIPIIAIAIRGKNVWRLKVRCFRILRNIFRTQPTWINSRQKLNACHIIFILILSFNLSFYLYFSISPSVCVCLLHTHSFPYILLLYIFVIDSAVISQSVVAFDDY